VGDVNFFLKLHADGILSKTACVRDQGSRVKGVPSTGNKPCSTPDICRKAGVELRQAELWENAFF
jgi:hypothetical protein